MSTYKCKRGEGHLHIVAIAITCNIAIFVLLRFIDVYEIISLIKVLIVLFNVYMFYNIVFILTMKYIFDSENIIVSGFWGLRKIQIPIKDIQSYFISRDPISSVKLYGFSSKKFAIGRFVVNKIGTTRMFATCYNLIYIKTEKINYALSPRNIEVFEEILNNKNVKNETWEYDYNKSEKLHSKTKFVILIILISIIIFVFTITPLVLYKLNLLPEQMPLTLNAKFMPLVIGSSQQFVSKQLTYGLINMGILLCMFFAAYSHIKYDEKTAYVYIYTSFFISITFFVMQFRILFEFIGV